MSIYPTRPDLLQERMIILDSPLSSIDKQRLYEAAMRRVSVRRYGAPPTGEQVGRLYALADALSNSDMRLVLLTEAGPVFGHGLLGRGITGVSCGVAFVSKKSAAPERVGYAGEPFLLECTALGLGTCWMQGTYSHGRARALVDLAAGEKLVAVSPLGHPEEGGLPPLADEERLRKPVAALTGLSDAQFEALPEWQRAAILCARGAPSSMNRQPWRFEQRGTSVAVTFKRASLNIGIAMFHLELGASVLGEDGRWRREDNAWVFTPDRRAE